MHTYLHSYSGNECKYHTVVPSNTASQGIATSFYDRSYKSVRKKDMNSLTFSSE